MYMHVYLLAGLRIEIPTWCGRWVVGMDEYADGVVGAKSKNLANLRGRLPSNINLPASVTLPFGCFEQVGAKGCKIASGKQAFGLNATEKKPPEL